MEPPRGRCPGGQATVLPSSRLVEIVRGLGIDPAHFHVLTAHRKHVDEDTRIIAAELAYHGPSVIILQRECIETARQHKAHPHKPAASPPPASAPQGAQP